MKINRGIMQWSVENIHARLGIGYIYVLFQIGKILVLFVMIL